MLKINILVIIFINLSFLLKAQGCDFLETDSIKLNIAHYNLDGAYTQQYALVSLSGNILDISLLPLFPPKNAGRYFVYALNYETAAGIAGFSIGNSISDITGSCLDTTRATVNVCVCSTECHSTDGTVNLSISRANTDAAFTQSYALTNNSGEILAINTSPSSLNPLFSGQSAGNYFVYALNYETDSGVNNYLIKNNIINVKGSCLDIEGPICYNICQDIISCHSENGTVNVNSNGFNREAGYTQSYALVDTNGVIQRIKDNPSDTNPLFLAVEPGMYEVYALNYETTTGINNYTQGNTFNMVTGICLDIANPIVYQVCNDNYDFGDLPDISDSIARGDYQTLLANDGPRHLIISGLSLGDSVDMELDGIPNITASGDGEDEDGLFIFSLLDIIPGMDFRLPLHYINTTGNTAYIEGWIDWNGDGDFGEADELVLDVNDGNSTTPIANRWDISIPANAVTDTYIGVRLRISLQDNMTPYGTQPNGEVEDYLLYLKCPKICLPITASLKKG